MTALKSFPAPSVPSVDHPCLVRKSLRSYELVDPDNPGEITSFDVGQVKAIVEMDGRLREEDNITSVPAGYSFFAEVFNKHASGPERFATFSYIHGKPVISKAGCPIIWDHFLIDDSIIGRHYDLILEASGPSSSQLLSAHPSVKTSTSDPASPRKELPQLQLLSAYMKDSMATTDELVKFWIKRGAIEFDYASRLARLSEHTIGEKEPSEFRDAIDAFRVEAARQAMNHNTLATQIALELESRCLKLRLAQSTHWLKVCEPSIKKLEEPVPAQEHFSHTGVSSEWKKEYKNIRYSLDIRRLRALRGSRSPFQLKGDPGLRDQNSTWGSHSRKVEWDSLLTSCRKMEEERSHFMEELMSAFSDVLSSIHDSHSESRTIITRAVDLFKPQEVVEEFSNSFMDDGDATQNADRLQQNQNSVGHALDRDHSLLSPWSPLLASPPPELTKTTVLEAQTEENGVKSRLRYKDLHVDGRLGLKHPFSSASSSQKRSDKRLSGPRPLPTFVSRPLSRSVSLSNHLPIHHSGQHGVRILPSPPKNKWSSQTPRNPRDDLPRIETNFELDYKKDAVK